MFKHVNFSYGTSGEVLHDIDLKIPAGTTLGILGSTGSGKSTLTYLLDRLYELRKAPARSPSAAWISATSRFRTCAAISALFCRNRSCSQRALRTPFRTVPIATILKACAKYARLAVIDDTIDRFAEGYDTQIGERGVTISGGQKQRVAIARMLMQNTPIKIFDDSLSAVDMETDAKIRESINKNVRGTTIFDRPPHHDHHECRPDHCHG